MSRPAGTTKRTKEEVIQAVRATRGGVYQAARNLGVHASVLYDYAKRWPEILDVIREERGLLIDTAESKLHEAVNNGEAWAICFFLKTQGKSRGYVEKTQFVGDSDNPIKHEHEHGGNISLGIGLTPTDLRGIAGLLEEAGRGLHPDGPAEPVDNRKVIAG